MIKELRAIIIIALPVGIFAGLYFLLGVWPNYLFGEVDTQGIYELEKTLFGVSAAGTEGLQSMAFDGVTMIPSEFFRVHHWAIMDVLSGIFYMCWVPLPLLYALILHWQGHNSLALRLTCAFLVVNIIGFCGYYIHPSSPPWYVMDHGFEVIFNTPGSAAGFANCDAVTGTTIFHDFYCHNANVFAAVPSLHSAYNPIAFFYAMLVPRNRVWQFVLGLVSVGIWFSAVYSGHHYVIDVILGVATTIVGILLFEKVIMRLALVKKYSKTLLNCLES